MELELVRGGLWALAGPALDIAGRLSDAGFEIRDSGRGK